MGTGLCSDWTLLFGLAAGATNLLGALVVVWRDSPWSARSLSRFLSVSAGFMLAAAILRMGPEATALTPSAPLWILGGYLLVQFFEHTIAPHFHFGEETHHDLVVSSSVWVPALVGLMVHSLFDGISIGSGFLVSPSLGLVVFSAILLHKAPEGLTIASVLLAAGASRGAAFAAAGAIGAASVVGVITVQWLSFWVGPALGLSTGVTLYVAASDLIPEVNKDEGVGMAILVFAGVALFYLSELVLDALGI